MIQSVELRLDGSMLTVHIEQEGALPDIVDSVDLSKLLVVGQDGIEKPARDEE